MITERVYIRTESLAEVHEQIAQMEANGWQKASTLLYVHDGEKCGWEMAMQRGVETDADVMFRDWYYSERVTNLAVALGLCAAIATVGYIATEAFKWLIQ